MPDGRGQGKALFGAVLVAAALLGAGVAGADPVDARTPDADGPAFVMRPARSDVARLSIPATVPVVRHELATDTWLVAGQGCAEPCCPPPAPCGCGFRRFEVWGEVWRPVISGSTFITLGGEPGTATKIDVDDDLDLDPAIAFEVGVSARLFGGRHRLSASYERLAFSGTSTLDEDEIFHGATYPAGAEVDTDLVLQFFKAGYDYQWLCRPRFEGWIGAAAWVWKFDQTMKAPGLDETRGFTHVLPVIHAGATYTSGRLRVGIDASGGFVGEDRSVVDLSAFVGVSVVDRVSIDAGWRWMDFHFRETTNEGDLTCSGPFLAVSVTF